jgi:phosphomannomutase/phosphoglucomutase
VKGRKKNMENNSSRKLFGTSGIRGPSGELLAPGLPERIGRTFAWFLNGRGRVFVGRDVRLHSEPLQARLTQGLMKGGLDVVDCGVVPTPALLFVMKNAKATAAVIVSGSHTPAKTAGLLFFLADTGEMDPRDESAFEHHYHSEPWFQSSAEKKGSLESLEIIESYLGIVANEIRHVSGYKVVVDPGNGATCATLPRALESLGCSVITINEKPDGRFPSRPPNPQPSNLSQLAQTVRETKADFGVATDSDGDRAIFATTEGHVLWGDLTSALFARNELEKDRRGTVVTTANTSSIVKLMCQQLGGQLIVTKVGPPAIAEALRTHEHVIFATEESGKHIWPKVILYGDAVLAGGKLLQIMSEHRMSLQQLVDTLPRLYQVKSELECPDELKASAMNFVNDLWKGDNNSEGSRLDGLKVEYRDLTWFLVRTSGTEPLLRCSAEGKSMEEARALLAKATNLAVAAISKARMNE